MPQVIHLEITLPEGAKVAISGQSDHSSESRSTVRDSEEVERYFRHYLSHNGRKLYSAAARIEQYQGPGYTLSDIAANLSLEYGSVKSYLITSGRSARRWKDETGTEAPIRLEDLSYVWVEKEHGMRSGYRLPLGVAEIIAGLEMAVPVGHEAELAAVPYQ